MRTYTDVIQRLGMAAYYSYMNGIADPVQQTLQPVIDGVVLVLGEGHTYGSVSRDVNAELQRVIKNLDDKVLQRVTPNYPVM